MSEFIVIGQRAEDGIAIDFSKPAVGELVRCKDCKYNNAEAENTDDSKPTCKAVCNLMIYVHNADDYCSYGERKEVEHE